jgi:hypothetical protein
VDSIVAYFWTPTKLVLTEYRSPNTALLERVGALSRLQQCSVELVITKSDPFCNRIAAVKPPFWGSASCLNFGFRPKAVVEIMPTRRPRGSPPEASRGKLRFNSLTGHGWRKSDNSLVVTRSSNG